MSLLARAGFALVRWKSRHGLRDDDPAVRGGAKREDLRVGVRGETYAYWYLRRQGYVFIARNYEPAREKGELDLVGFDGETLAFVEVRTRAVIAGRQGGTAGIEHQQGETPGAGAHGVRLSARTPCEGVSRAVRRGRHRQHAGEAAGGAPAQGCSQPKGLMLRIAGRFSCSSPL